MTAVYYDYRLKFPKEGLSQALAALQAIHDAGFMGDEAVPQNMLGSPRDGLGAVSVSSPAWRGDPGAAAITYTEPDTGQSVSIPARGDPAYFYIHIRTTVPPASLPFDPAAYGLMPCSAAESAAVLGVWA